MVTVSPHVALNQRRRVCCDLSSSLMLDAANAASQAQVLKALSHPIRLQILDIVSRHGGQACVCDIEGQFELSQPTISHHLKVLRQAGLIESEQRGLWVYHSVRSGAVQSLITFLNGFQVR